MKKKIFTIISIVLVTVMLASAAIYLVAHMNEANAQSDGSDGKPKTRAELLVPENNDFLSRGSSKYENVNGKTVNAYTFYRDTNERGNNPNFSQALLIYQCIKYKQKYPQKDVTITCSSFHFSVALSACVDKDSPEYGHMKNLYDREYDSKGYYRLSYLLVWAASLGIDVTVIGQTDAAGVDQNGVVLNDFSFVEYFTSHLSDPAQISGKTVGDFMKFGYAAWKSYGDKSAADMMHNKLLSVSNFIDNDGEEHGSAIWTGSINLDGVSYAELNGNNSVQTAIIITEHDELRRVIENYLTLMLDYCSQEDIVPFRDKVCEMNTEQIALITAGKADQIPEDERIVYLGGENDDIFELYFTPLGGGFSTWNIQTNPYAKYIDKLISGAETGEPIEFIWDNVKYKKTFELGDMMMEGIRYAFEINGNAQSILNLHLPNEDDPEFGNWLRTYFEDLVEGQNIGVKNINVYENRWWYHTKDVQLSYVEDSGRKWVTMINSLNIHEGSMYHQTNTILVIKENETTGNDLYVNYAQLTNPHMDFLSRRFSK